MLTANFPWDICTMHHLHKLQKISVTGTMAYRPLYFPEEHHTVYAAWMSVVYHDGLLLIRRWCFVPLIISEAFTLAYDDDHHHHLFRPICLFKFILPLPCDNVVVTHGILQYVNVAKCSCYIFILLAVRFDLKFYYSFTAYADFPSVSCLTFRSMHVQQCSY